ncbi:MAG: hypothetical protein KA100_05555 [Rickettsiales bacterium]|nr:hypothetical protein [Rickettsiales bacterium]
MKKILSILAIFFFAFSCAEKIIDVKSPCVSTEDGPCGPKKSINQWWLNSQNNHKQNS